MYRAKFKTISFICFLACIVIWIPNIVFQVSSPLWILTFLIAGIGTVLAILSKSYWLVALNTIMFFSFFILMALGYFINSIVR